MRAQDAEGMSMVAPPAETCENCGREIRAAEPAHVYRNRVVCGPCSAWLRAADDAARTKSLTAATRAAAGAATGAAAALPDAAADPRQYKSSICIRATTPATAAP